MQSCHVHAWPICWTPANCRTEPATRTRAGRAIGSPSLCRRTRSRLSMRCPEANGLGYAWLTLGRGLSGRFLAELADHALDGLIGERIGPALAELTQLPANSPLQQRLDPAVAPLALHHHPNRLAVADGAEHRLESLGALRLGGLAYHPVFQDVSFRLTLANPSRRTVSEEARLSLRP